MNLETIGTVTGKCIELIESCTKIVQDNKEFNSSIELYEEVANTLDRMIGVMKNKEESLVLSSIWDVGVESIDRTLCFVRLCLEIVQKCNSSCRNAIEESYYKKNPVYVNLNIKEIVKDLLIENKDIRRNLNISLSVLDIHPSLN